MDIVEDLRMNHEYCPKEVILAAADEIEHQRNRANILAATIRELSDVVTSDCESKKDFIGRVRKILSVMPNVGANSAALKRSPMEAEGRNES